MIGDFGADETRSYRIYVQESGFVRSEQTSRSQRVYSLIGQVYQLNVTTSEIDSPSLMKDEGSSENSELLQI